MVSLDGRVARGGDDALVRGQQVVGVGVEVRDPADHRSAGDEVVAVQQQLRHQVDVPGIPFHERVRPVIVVGLRDPAVLREIVDTDHFVTATEKLLHHVPTDKASRAADEDSRHYSHSPCAVVDLEDVREGLVTQLLRERIGLGLDRCELPRERAWNRRRIGTTADSGGATSAA